MSNQACLFADDDPLPYNPSDYVWRSGADTVHVAGAAYEIPAFWMFCFAWDDQVEVGLSDGKFSALVASLDIVRERLQERDQLARTFFPEYTDLWARWKRIIYSVDRSYLKLDPYEIWMMYKNPDELTTELKCALDWFANRDDYGFTSLLKLAGIDDYDNDTRRMIFDEKESCPEKFLIGWLEITEPGAESGSSHE